MAFSIIEQRHKPNTMWLTFLCDTDADIDNLPTDSPAGSRAIVAKNGNLYLLDSLGAWNPMPGNVEGGGGGGGSTAKVLWEGDVSTTPQEFDYEFNPITCDYYFNDDLYTYIDWQSYDDGSLYTISFLESGAEVEFGTYDGNNVIMATGAGHLKVVEKTNKCIMIDAIYQGDQYTVIQTSFFDILDALENGYVLTLHVNGIVDGANYDSVGPISASYIQATSTAIFTAGATKGTVYFTWTVNADGSIVGTIGGGVDS